MNKAQEINDRAMSNGEALDLAERAASSFQRPAYNVTKYVFDDNSTLTFTFDQFRGVKSIKASK